MSLCVWCVSLIIFLRFRVDFIFAKKTKMFLDKVNDFSKTGCVRFRVLVANAQMAKTVRSYFQAK